MSMALKDAMRDHCLEEIADAWIQLVGSLHAQNPELAAAVLDVVARYVNWVDISLFVANDRHALPPVPMHPGIFPKSYSEPWLTTCPPTGVWQ